ncbi:hypothetical protein JKP88DRAFT_329980 [Tribonema minus]|uniref:Uncharacterized protein n=1 Tax=Tribonema minus TaxID=303371 RepID=A0A836CBK6_9STRA|nr:hypothetical protein JKP88DRAFT_329980 [Tribonema minus]
MANRTDASCDNGHVRHLLKMVASGVNRLREQHPWLDGLPEGDGGTSAQQPNVPPHVAMELDNADHILTALKAAVSCSRPGEHLEDRLKLQLDEVHRAGLVMRAHVGRSGSGGAGPCSEGKEQSCGQLTPVSESAEDLHDTRGPAQRQRLGAPTPDASAVASAVLASEPGSAVWQMLGRGYWLTVASVSRGIRTVYTRELLCGGSSSSNGGGSGDSDCAWLCRTSVSAVLHSDAVLRMALDMQAISLNPVPAGTAPSPAGWRISDDSLTTLLNNSPRTMVQVGRAQLSCNMIRDAMSAGLLVDGHALVGAAERGCEAALNQWHRSLAQRPAWRAQRSWVLPGAEVQLPPVLLTLLACKCARYGDFDTFRWLYTEGQRLAQQDITVKLSAADLKAFKEEVVVPFRAACTDDLLFLKVLTTGITKNICTLMDSAILFGQEKFVVALSRFDVAPELSCFTPRSAVFAASCASLSLLQWLHGQSACPFDGSAEVIIASVCRIDPLPPGTGAEAAVHNPLERLGWLHISAVNTAEPGNSRCFRRCAVRTGPAFCASHTPLAGQGPVAAKCDGGWLASWRRCAYCTRAQ